MADKQTKHDPLLGETIAGRYEVIELIGSGGYGSVYKAKHLQVGNTVAIKVLRAEYVEDKKIAARFQNEARIAGHLRNPHITAAFDQGICDKTKVLFIAMEYVSGPSLKALIEPTHGLEVERALHILIQLCDGISEAHNKNVLHRDIKPSNIILTNYDNDPDFVKITDFGIAKVLSESEELKRLTTTGMGSPEGTCLYMAPEQFKEGYKPSFPLDVYSIGCVLFEALTGKPPFNGGSDVVTASLHATAKIPDLTLDSVEPVIKSRLSDILNKSLAKEPSMRYQTVDGLRNDLELVNTKLTQLQLGNANKALLSIEKLYLFLSQKNRDLQALFKLSDREAKTWSLAAAAALMIIFTISGWIIFRPICYAFGPVPGKQLRRIPLELLVIPHKQKLFDSQTANDKTLSYIKNNIAQRLDQEDISTCLQKAKQYFSFGEYERAAKYCQTGEDLCLKNDINTLAYFDEVIEICIIHAESCLRMKNYKQASDVATYTKGHLGRAGKHFSYEAFLAFGLLAESNYQAGLIKEANKYYEDAMKRYAFVNIVQHTGDTQLAYTLSRAGKFYEEQNNGNTDKAILLLKSALECWKEYIRKDPENPTLLFNASVVQNDLGISEGEYKQYDLSHQYFELAKDDMVKAKRGSDINYAKILFNNSDSLWKLKYLYSALQERSNGRRIWLRFFPSN